ncbi:glycosyltransferase family 39 protein [Ectobacillus sp. sgz5001026]|uniref:glycosyltransferase family 39 protein n=1 Tax=Ectobacillus sp. sgz5001026 TaxID=3242473 RepID=UPI0036D21E9B
MKSKEKGRIDLLLVAILIFSLFLNFYQVTKAGSNTYYTVAVKSMLTSFHNFFFVSYDPAGFITVDKPPVALWIQALSAAIFGVNDFSVILPEALAGVVSVWLLYRIVKPKFGRSSALLSSLTLACTPIFVAVVRTNNVDSILIVTLLLATMALMKAVEKQKLSWLIVSVMLVGIGFNVKMLQAYMVLPAFYLFYLFAVKTSWKKKIAQLAIATVVLAAVSLSWAVVVDSISKDNRPYIGSSQTNSVLELAFGYNGISRLTGDKGNQPKKNDQAIQGQLDFGNAMPNGNNPVQSGTNSFSPPGGQGMGGMFGTGKAGVLRLFQKELSGQASWLLPFVLFTVIGVFASLKSKRELTMQQYFTAFWALWLLPMLVFFSIAQFFHQYYLSMMGPAIAALTGIGWTALWKLYKEKQGWMLLPGAIFITSVFEAIIIYENSSAIAVGWMIVPLGLGIILSGLLIFLKEREKAAYYTSLAGVLSLLIFPFVWTMWTVLGGGNSTLPVAGPSTQQNFMRGGPIGEMPPGGPGSVQNGSSMKERFDNGEGRPNRGGQGFARGNMPGRGTQVNQKLLTYLENNYTGETFLYATESSQEAGSTMLNTNYAVMAMGGFSGSDPALSVSKLEYMLKEGQVKYFLISGQGRGNQEVTKWITSHCKEVPSSEWQATSSTTDNQAAGMSQKLYVYQG